MRLIYRIKQLMLIGGDWLSYVLAFYVSLFIRNLQSPTWDKIEQHISLFFILFLSWLIINFVNGLYDLSELKKQKFKLYFLEASILSLIFSIIIIYIWPNKTINPKTILILNILLGYTLSFFWRKIYNTFVGEKKIFNKIAFVGFESETAKLIKIIEDRPELGYKIIFLFDPENKIEQNDFPFFDILHDSQKILETCKKNKTQMLIVSPKLKQNQILNQQIYKLLFSNIEINDLTSFYEVITGRVTPSVFSESWFIENLKTEKQPIYKKIKSLLDYLIGAVIATFFIITFPFIFLIIKINSPGPVFYRQERVGKNGKIFWLYKYRSMHALNKDGGAELDGAEFATTHDNRITKVGKFLRKSRLDELPQFINLLKGDITLIGPRPERPEIVAQLVEKMPYYNLRHITKPGLTGWAAVHQHYTDTLEKSLEKLQYDLFYIKNKSFLLDLSILLRTINVILRMKGQ